jgi:RimJ/RimL family protein N-acetyltransferase
MDAQRTLPVGPLVKDPSAAPWPPRREINGKFVVLRPLDAGRDGDQLFAVSHPPGDDGALWTYMSYGPFPDAVAMTAWLEVQQAQQDPLFFTVADQPSRQPMGLVSYLNIAPEMQRLEIGHIWYGYAYQRTAANTEAAYLLLRTAFNELGYRRVEWKCDVLNARSRDAALRLGFRPEGIFRKHYIVKQRSRDTIWFSIVDDEWPDVRANLEGWLAAPEPRPSLHQMTVQQQGKGFGALRT